MIQERWRRPVVPLHIEEHGREVIWTPDGRRQRQAVFTLREEDKERMRLGYVCAKCLEPFEHAWPERCHQCGVAVRRDQAAFFAREFDPKPLDLTRTDWEAELERLKEGQ